MTETDMKRVLSIYKKSRKKVLQSRSMQVCSMTFVSWTFPTSQVDLMAKREERALRADIPKYFADSGEWRLDDITVKKLVRSFL